MSFFVQLCGFWHSICTKNALRIMRQNFFHNVKEKHHEQKPQIHILDGFVSGSGCGNAR